MNYKELKLKEKKELMTHWFHYYGKSVFTFKELEDYRSLLDTNMDEVVTFATFLYVDKKGPTELLENMRRGKVETIFSIVKEFNESQDEQKQHDLNIYRNLFIEEINGTYKNPLPSVPMEPKVMSKQIQDIINNTKKDK